MLENQNGRADGTTPTPAPGTPAAPATGLTAEQISSALSNPEIAKALKVKTPDGKEVGYNELLESPMFKADHTRKTQELAAQRAAFEQERAAAGAAKPPAETLLDAMEQVIARSRTVKPEDPLSNPATRREYLQSKMNAGMTPEEAIDLVLSRTDATIASSVATERGERDKSLKEIRDEVAALKKDNEAQRVQKLRDRISTEVPECQWLPDGSPANSLTLAVGFYANSQKPLEWLGGRKGVDVDEAEVAKAYKSHVFAEHKAMVDAETKRLADLRANAAGEGGAGAPGKFGLLDDDNLKNEKDHGKRLEAAKAYEASLRAGVPQ